MGVGSGDVGYVEVIDFFLESKWIFEKILEQTCLSRKKRRKWSTWY